MSEEVINLIAKQTQILDRLDVIEAARGSVLEQLLVLAKEREKREVESVNYSWPKDGTYAELELGTTEVNFYTGKIVTLKAEPGKSGLHETVTEMHRSLQSEGRRWLRSFMVNANKSIGIQLDGGDVELIEDGYAIGRRLAFRTITIVTDVATKLFVHVSTNPETTLELTSDKTRIAAIIEAAAIDPLTLSGRSNELLTKLLERD